MGLLSIYYKIHCSCLQVSQLGEGVDDDTEDDVETNGGDEHEEGHVVEDDEPKPLETLFRVMGLQFL